MKKSMKLGMSFTILTTTSLFATNGATLIGMGAEARGMAGTGIAISHGAESALTNPALITSVKTTEISFGGTFFMPDVKNNNGGAKASSDADLSVIPEVSLATKIDNNFYIGIGMWGTGGMGVDYRKSIQQLNMVTNLQLMQFGVPLAYQINDLSVAITPILQYGSLDINYDMDGDLLNGSMGMGVAQDLKFGYNIGLSYEISNITIGAIYKSQIDMEYKGFSNLIQPFTNPNSIYTNNKLSTPMEIGIGIGYKIGHMRLALDYKQIKWADAKGYKDFEWDNQNVISLGYEYNMKTLAIRMGYNYASSPISEQSGNYNNSVGLNGYTLNMFNLLGFPAIIQSHYAVGTTFSISEKTSIDLAYTYSPESSQSYKIFDRVNNVAYNMETKHSQSSFGAQLNFNF